MGPKYIFKNKQVYKTMWIKYQVLLNMWKNTILIKIHTHSEEKGDLFLSKY